MSRVSYRPFYLGVIVTSDTGVEIIGRTTKSNSGAEVTVPAVIRVE